MFGPVIFGPVMVETVMVGLVMVWTCNGWACNGWTCNGWTCNCVLLSVPSAFQPIDVSGLHLGLVERQSEMPAQSKFGIPCVIPDPDTKPMRSATVVKEIFLLKNFFT